MLPKQSLTQIIAIVSLVAFTGISQAEETTMEKVETGANKATDSVKGTYRDAKDKACEMVNGKW